MASYDSDMAEQTEHIQGLKGRQKTALDDLRAAERKVAKMQKNVNKSVEEEEVGPHSSCSLGETEDPSPDLPTPGGLPLRYRMPSLHPYSPEPVSRCLSG